MDPSSLKTSMEKAIRENNLSCVVNLLKQGCSPDVVLQKSSGLSALIHATNYGHSNIVRKLLSRKAVVDFRDKHSKTALMYASMKNEVGILKDLVKQGSDVNCQDNNGRTAFLHAAQSESFECLQFLLLHGNTDINRVDCDGKSAVAYAACGKESRCLELLIDHEADVNIANKHGNCPLAIAIHSVKIHNAIILIDKGARLNVLNNEGKSPLFKAMAQARNSAMLPVILKLLVCRARPNNSTLDENFIHEMIARDQLDIVRQMVINGCTPRLRVCKGSVFRFTVHEPISPFAAALLCGQLATAKYFLASLFLTPYDLHLLPNHGTVLSAMNQFPNLDRCKCLLKDFSSSILPLQILSLVTLQTVYYRNSSSPCSQYLKNFISENLHHELQRRLHFQTKCSYLCVHEWETIPLVFQSTPSDQSQFPFWSIEDRVEKCSFNHGQSSDGYRVVKDESLESIFLDLGLEKEKLRLKVSE